MLRNVIECLGGEKASRQLYVGDHSTGHLSHIPGLNTTFYPYKRFSSKLLQLLSYLFSQVYLFLRLSASSEARNASVIWVNTVLPFGSLVFAKLFRVPAICHVHEVALSPPILSLFLFGIANQCANEIVFVSKAQKELLKPVSKRFSILSNGLDRAISERSSRCVYTHRREGVFNVVMLASLRPYKGIDTFIKLAQDLGERTVKFRLVLNDDIDKVREYREKHSSVSFLEIHDRVENPSDAYESASVLLNLSYPDQWIETFGLTIIEAFSFGVPVIAPPVGGPTELVSDGIDGFLIDSREYSKLRLGLLRLIEDQSLCMELSNNAKRKAQHYTPARFCENTRQTVERFI